MRNILIVSFLCLNTVVFAQDNISEPQVSDSVVMTIAISACNCTSKLDMQTITTSEQRKTAMNNCLIQSTNENAVVIAADKNADMTKGRNAGKQYGVVLGRKLVPLLMSDCPAFKLLVQ